MQTVRIPYGKNSFDLSFDPSSFTVVGGSAKNRPLPDRELGLAIDEPVVGPRLEEIVEDGGTVLIVVPDATRRSASGQVVNLLIRRLIAAGVMPYDINAIFATGIHRPVTEEEKAAILTPFIAQRTATLEHRPRDLMNIVRLGETRGGIPVELNRALNEFDHVITVGSVTFHYFAGFTGGRKLICPGLASSRTVAETHKLAFDTEKLSRAEGVGPGRLGGNPVHEAFVEAVEFASPSFSVNTIVDGSGAAYAAVCGDWIEAHEKACERYAAEHVIEIESRRPIVAAGCGGYPFDINLIQAHKALDSASYACEEGGTIVLFAECPDGTGKADMAEWFEASSSAELAEKLAGNYKVNGQTAWSIRQKAERFDVRMVTDLPAELVEMAGMKKIGADEAQDIVRSSEGGYILPFGAKFLPRVAVDRSDTR
ncbi:MAG: nickel-dependent lactate racemase [Acidobacteriota bacterium]|nr:MAG: nickel-dependent lactate racemase [Acidobacteriota bacterium]